MGRATILTSAFLFTITAKTGEVNVSILEQNLAKM